MKRITWWHAVAACILALPACGGGGGGGNGTPDAPPGNGGTGTGGTVATPPPPSSGDGSVTVTADKAELVFVGFERNPPLKQQVIFTLQGGQGTFYADMRSEPPGGFGMDFQALSPTTAQVTVHSGGLPVGHQSGQLNFRLCHDAECTKVAWQQAIPYKASIFAVTPAFLSFSSREGVPANPITLTVTPPDDAGLLTANAGAEPALLTVTRNGPGSFTIQPDASQFRKGNHQVGLSLVAAQAAGGASQYVSGNYAVDEVLITPRSQSLQLTMSSTPQSLKGTIDVGFADGQGRAWTVRSDQPWLQLASSQGTGAGPIAYSVDVSKLIDTPNGTEGKGTVVISTPGLSDAVMTVGVLKLLPELHTVSPSSLTAMQPATVRVVGRYLMDMRDVSNIYLDGAPVPAGTIESWGSAVLQLPALPAGGHTLSVRNSFGVTTPIAGFTTVQPGGLAYATAPHPGAKRSAIFDASRNAVFAVQDDTRSLIRWRLTGAQWSIDEVPIDYIGHLAMSPNQQTLYVRSGDRQLLEIDPDTLRIRATHVASYDIRGLETPIPRRPPSTPLGITNDMRLWFPHPGTGLVSFFDMLKGTFEKSGISVYDPWLYASGDGSRLLITERNSPPERHQLYTAPTGNATVMTAIPGLVQAASFSNDGNRLLGNLSSLFASQGANNFVLNGKIPTLPTISNSVLSPDGTRVYAVVLSAGSSASSGRIDVYDATSPNPQTLELAKVGQIQLQDLASECAATANDCSLGGQLLIAPLGDTLLWLGNKQLVVIPVPSDLRPSTVPTARLQRAAVPR